MNRSRSDRPRAVRGAFASLWIAILAHQLLSSSSSGSLDAYLINTDARGLARFLHGKIEMTDSEIATASNVANEQTVRRWRSRGSKSVPRRNEQLDDLRAIVGLFLQSGVMYPEEIGRWLRSRIAELNYARPYVLLGKGRFDQVKTAAEHHLQRLEGRVLEPSLDDEMEQLFAAPSAENAPDEARR